MPPLPTFQAPAPVVAQPTPPPDPPQAAPEDQTEPPADASVPPATTTDFQPANASPAPAATPAAVPQGDTVSAGPARSSGVGIWLFVILLGVGGVCVLAVVNRDEVSRAYYRSQNPHPAEELVREAIASRRTSPGAMARLDDALGEPPPRDRILSEVRLEQAEQLVAELEAEVRRRTREYEREARADPSMLDADTVFLGSQEALAHAAVALEKAKAASAAARAVRESESDYG